MTNITNDEQRELDALAAKFRTKNARREQLQREAAERIAGELAALEQEIANEAARLSRAVPKRRVFQALGIAPMTLDALIARGVVVEAAPTVSVADAPTDGTVDRPQFAILNGLLNVSTEEHSAKAGWQRLDDESILFSSITPEWSADWKDQNPLVVGLRVDTSPLYAEAVAFIEEWEMGNA